MINRITIKSRKPMDMQLRELLVSQSITQDPHDIVYYGIEDTCTVSVIPMVLHEVDAFCKKRTFKRTYGPIPQNFRHIPIINYP